MTARIERSFACGFLGCKYVAETRLQFIKHVVNKHGAWIVRQRAKMGKRSKKS